MKRIMATILVALSVIALTGCSDFNSQSYNESSDKISNEELSDIKSNDEITGPLVMGTYRFDKYEDVEYFYSIYLKKNIETFIIPNFDDKESSLYFFECSGIHSHIIYEEIYDYDFPSPHFIIETKDYTIYLEDYSSFSITLSSNDKVDIIQNKLKVKEMNIYAGENIIARLKYEIELSTDEIDSISNKFMEKIKNVY